MVTLSQLALSGMDIKQLMNETVILVSETLNVEFCELMEFLPEGDRLILRDGVGWKDDHIGVTTVGTNMNSHAGYTLTVDSPVIMPDLESETRFKPPELLRTHGVKSGITVVIHSDKQPYGVLGAHTAKDRQFTTADGHFLQLIANTLAMAISNRRLLESEAERRRKAERANEERLKALGIVAHELRTPLTSIKGFATTMLADDVTWSPDQQVDFIQTISAEADKLGNLIEQLLDLSRMEVGAFKITLAKQDLAEIVAVYQAQLKALTTHHELEIHLPPSLPPVLADTQRTGQVLVNLVENAAKYSPAGTCINVSAEAGDAFVTISVQDQGQGIAPEDAGKVFNPFYRADNKATSKSSGSGLGLFICQRLVEAQGGKIWIDDTAASGACFRFTLPVARAIDTGVSMEEGRNEKSLSDRR